MKKYIINGGKKLEGEVEVSGSKNVILKALIAACLTDEEITIKNVPLLRDFFVMLELIRGIGGEIELIDHVLKIRVSQITNVKIPLDVGAKIRTSSMFLAPLLARCNEALIPNPGGCRIGQRSIGRHIKGLEAMGASIVYLSEDGYFHAKTDQLKGAEYTFEKNTHTGTETLILAAVLAKGRTILNNAAQEPEIDDLINLLNEMGAKVKRENNRRIVIDGVKKLKGVTYTIMPDRNEVMTFAIASALTGGNITVKNADLSVLSSFLEKFKEAGGNWEINKNGVRFYIDSKINPINILTSSHPGFMTDWQGPWAILATQGDGISTIHETVYEDRFGYVKELRKMGAKINYYVPEVDNPEKFYNFDYKDGMHKHAIRIKGPCQLHNAVLNISDLRAGATLVLASLIAKGKSIVYGIEHLERGYEDFDKRLIKLGADIKVKENNI